MRTVLCRLTLSTKQIFFNGTQTTMVIYPTEPNQDSKAQVLCWYQTLTSESEVNTEELVTDQRYSWSRPLSTARFFFHQSGQLPEIERAERVLEGGAE